MAVLLIGSNDVMAADRPDRATSYMKKNKLPRKPDLDWSVGELRALVPRLRSAVPRLGLCTLPPLGDDPNHPICDLVEQYNDVVRQLAVEHDCVLLDVHAALLPLLLPKLTPYEGSPSHVVSVIGKAVLTHYLRGFSWDSIADTAGYGATVEGIHLTDAAAKRVADLVAEFVESASSP
jgi:lysophospholipase L1-like esterase